jgi:putative membrane protein
VVALALRFLIALATGAACAAARAHSPDEAAPAGAWAALHWGAEPWVLALLAASIGWYAFGVGRLWRHAGRGHGISPARAAAFAAGWLALALALASPLDALGGWLFSAHMVQHEVLMVLAAPLMVLGRPIGAWAWGLSPSGRRLFGRAFHRPRWRRFWRALTTPWAAWALHAAALWLWHAPAAFDAALRHEGVHSLQHASFLFSALLFWWTVLGPPLDGARPGAAMLSLFTTMMHSAALGALLALSPLVWYAPYVERAAALGWSALEDQQLGGLVMWAPAGLAYFAAGLLLARRLLQGTARMARVRA